MTETPEKSVFIKLNIALAIYFLCVSLMFSFALASLNTTTTALASVQGNQSSILANQNLIVRNQGTIVHNESVIVGNQTKVVKTLQTHSANFANILKAIKANSVRISGNSARIDANHESFVKFMKPHLK